MGTVLNFVGPGQPLVVRARGDALPGNGELLVQISCCTLCRSDLSTWSGKRPGPTPSVLGHEIVGRIMAFGPEASSLDARGTACVIGDRISWTVSAHCGLCFFCLEGLTQKCLSLRKYGHEQCTDDDPYRGGLADQIVLWPGTAWVKLPDALPDEVAAMANCSGATAASVLRLAGSVSGRCVVILGGGILGLFACAMAKEAGAASVIVSDPVEANRYRALSFGATHVMPADSEDFLSGVRSLTNDRGADIVLELAGTSSAVQAGLRLLRIGGTLILAGTVSNVESILLDPEMVVRRLLTIRGLHNYHANDLLAAIDFLSNHLNRYPFATLIGALFPLPEAESAFRYTDLHPGMRAAIRPEMR